MGEEYSLNNNYDGSSSSEDEKDGNSENFDFS